MGQPESQFPPPDPAAASTARIYNYLIGGDIHSPADRAAAGRILAGFPEAQIAAWFTGLELVPPGLTDVQLWPAGQGQAQALPSARMLRAVGQRPAGSLLPARAADQQAVAVRQRMPIEAPVAVRRGDERELWIKGQ
jgi:hypothetical protein